MFSLRLLFTNPEQGPLLNKGPIWLDKGPILESNIIRMELLTDTRPPTLDQFAIPEPRMVLQIPEGEGGFTFQQYPKDEIHNLISPQFCWCIPRIFAYFDEDGQVDVVVTEHNYEM